MSAAPSKAQICTDEFHESPREVDLDRLLCDALFFVFKLQPQKDQHNSAATVLACTRSDRLRALPAFKHETAPGRHAELRELAEQVAIESGMQAGPLCRLGQTQDAVVNTVTKQAVERLLCNSTEPLFENTPRVQISTVTHENQQLQWRPGVPLCDSGAFCAVFTIPRAHEPGRLPAYLYPEEERAYQETGTAPRRTAGMFCLLCIRRAAHCTTLAEQATQSLGGGAPRPKLLPPFTNLCDVVDGYKREVMGVTPANMTFRGGVHVCGVHGDMEVKYDRLRSCWYINQGAAMVFSGATERA